MRAEGKVNFFCEKATPIEGGGGEGSAYLKDAFLPVGQFGAHFPLVLQLGALQRGAVEVITNFSLKEIQGGISV